MSRALWVGVVLLVVIGMVSVIGRGVFPGDLARRVDPARQRALSALGIEDPLIAKRPDELKKFDGRFAADIPMTLMHVVTGGLLLILTPLQFSSRVRNRYLRFHRWSGRLLITSGLIAALTGFYFGLLVPYGGPGETAAIVFFGGLFVFSLIRAFVAIRKRQVELHREWMIRAVAIVLGVSMVRVVGAVLDVALTPSGIAPPDLFVLSLWLGWGMTLIAGEAWIRHSRPQEPMRRSALFAAVLAAAILGTACSRPGPDLDAEQNALRSADRAWAAASEAKKAEESLAFLAEDAVMFPPGQPPVVGKPAIRQFILGSLNTPGFSVTWTTDFVDVAAGGGLGYAFGRSRYTIPDAAGALQTIHAKGVSVWRRESDGRWLCVADIWNDAPELPAPIHPRPAP
ncbi:MAG: DUF2306 domain-containing protein [Thermoanaerobaculia bacterium]|nr:DUF2306 domain-containing protein [Thermoanaerobaculia bacterium]